MDTPCNCMLSTCIPAVHLTYKADHYNEMMKTHIHLCTNQEGLYLQVLSQGPQG